MFGEAATQRGVLVLKKIINPLLFKKNINKTFFYKKKNIILIKKPSFKNKPPNPHRELGEVARKPIEGWVLKTVSDHKRRLRLHQLAQFCLFRSGGEPNLVQLLARHATLHWDVKTY